MRLRVSGSIVETNREGAGVPVMVEGSKYTPRVRALFSFFPSFLCCPVERHTRRHLLDIVVPSQRQS
jgi:hypothetical protein